MFKINISTDELTLRKNRIDNVYRFIENDRPAFLCYVDIFQYLRAVGIECEDYLKDPKIHLTAQLNFQKYLLEEFSTDQYSVNLAIDMFVVRLANAFGSNVRYIKGSLPWTNHWLKDEQDLIKLEKMDVCNNGLFLSEKDFRKYGLDNARRYPVELSDGNVFFPLENLKIPRFDCDGVFSIAQLIMGMEELFVACYDRPEFVHKLLDIITEKYIEHWKDVVTEFGVNEVDELVLADDTATYLNPEMFEEFCIPYMKRIRNTFPKARTLLHFCKAVPEYVDMIMKEINIHAFTGFKPKAGLQSISESYKPVRDVLGNRIVLYPDTDPCIVETASCEEVYQEVIDILDTFKNTKGICISFSTWSAKKSKAGMKACEDYARMNSR